MRTTNPTFSLSPVAAPMTWELVTQHIEQAILNGIVGPGERLPPERELAKQLAVSRTVLRDALKNLLERRLICTTQGGGNYVNDMIGKNMTDPLSDLLKDNAAAHLDFMEYRAEFEGRTAALAASRATPPDSRVLSMILDRMKVVHNQKDVLAESRLDADFHMAIAEATHNMVIIHVSQSMRDLMQQELLNARRMIFDQESGREKILEQHADIFEAIMDHNPNRAENAMRAHINHVTASFRELGQYDQRNEIARQRLSRWEATLAQANRRAAT